jgi:LysM repeat protein
LISIFFSMKPHTLPVKRNPVSKGVFKRLSAVTRNRKQRVAATADGEFEDDDHSSKISRALTIIFLIHIVVIGLIFFHQKFLDDGSAPVTTAKKVSPAAPVLPSTMTKLSSGEEAYMPEAGDNYERIAARKDVDVADLRAANDNRDILPGRILRIPPKRIVAVDPPEVAAIRESTPADRDRGLVEAIPVSGGAPRAQLVKATMPENHFTATAPPAAAPVVTKPRVATPPVPPRATPVAAATPKPSAKSYVVQPGDNVWRIANKFKVDQKALMKANGISDPKKLKLGMSLKIPQ